MNRLCFFFFFLALVACNNKKQTKENKQAPTATQTSASTFSTLTLPYTLTDSSLLSNKDTTTMKDSTLILFIPDSVKTKIVGSTKNIKYFALGKIKGAKNENYYLVKLVSGSRKAVLLAAYSNKDTLKAVLPFLVPDNDPQTTQVSTLDKSFSISRNISRRGKDDVVTEGKDVYNYNATTNQFTLVMTDVLDEGTPELINPIDTLAHTYKWTGDYVKDKHNIVSLRNGRNPNELTFFIHFENGDDCYGELKGAALMTSSTSAVYRQGGTPCVLEFHFSNNSVRLSEVEGCGAFRGFKCVFDGSFPKKKEPKPKAKEKTPKK